LNYKC